MKGVPERVENGAIQKCGLGSLVKNIQVTFSGHVSGVLDAVRSTMTLPYILFSTSDRPFISQPILISSR